MSNRELTRPAVSARGTMRAALSALALLGIGFALGRVGVFPLVPWRVSALDELGATVSTANATWWLVLVTGLSCVAAIAVFWSAFEVQRRQFRNEHNREQEKIKNNGRDAVETVERSNVLVIHLRGKYCDPTMPIDRGLIWRDLSRLQDHQTVMQRFLSSSLTEIEVLFLLASSSQRLYAARDALKRLVPDKEETGVTDGDRAFTRETLVEVGNRVVLDQEGMRAAVKIYAPSSEGAS